MFYIYIYDDYLYSEHIMKHWTMFPEASCGTKKASFHSHPPTAPRLWHWDQPPGFGVLAAVGF